MDLTGREPKEATDKRIFHVQEAFILDMCCVQDEGKQFFAAAADILGVSSYNTETGKREWNVRGRVDLSGMEKDMSACGVTTDGRGHLFVGDMNNKCIQMFSVSDGQYLGCLIRDLGDPARIRWWEEKSSLFVMCYLQNKWHLKVINVQY